MRRVSILSLSVAIALLILVPGITQATIHIITMSGTSFSPLGTIVHAGDTVRWRDDTGIHTTTSDVASTKAWSSGTMNSGQHFDVVFTAANGSGPFPYHCNFHSSLGMVDTIHVAVTSCCVGQRGNVNGSGIIDLVDLSSLVSYLTGGGFVPPCPEAANVNGVGIVDLVDLSSLVSFLTGGGYVPPNCP